MAVVHGVLLVNFLIRGTPQKPLVFSVRLNAEYRFHKNQLLSNELEHLIYESGAPLIKVNIFILFTL